MKYSVILDGVYKLQMSKMFGCQEYVSVITAFINSNRFNINNLPKLYIDKYFYTAHVYGDNDYITLVVSNAKNGGNIYNMVLTIVDENDNRLSPRDINNIELNFDWVIEKKTIDEIKQYIHTDDVSMLPYDFLSSVRDYLQKCIKSLSNVENISEIYNKHKKAYGAISNHIVNTVIGNKIHYELDRLEYYVNMIAIVVTVTFETIHSSERMSCRQVSTLIIKHEI